jgi:RimJ/RimL family protein N-acetyltransferase
VAVRPDDGRMLGYQILEPFAAYTAAFDHVATIGTFVDLSLRRQGIARRLFAASFEDAAKAGFEKFFTFVRSDNPAALAAYLAQGFTIVGTARDHAKIDGRYIDEVMIIGGNPHPGPPPQRGKAWNAMLNIQVQ